MTGLIAHVVEDLGLGGMERAIQSFARLARRAGFETRVVCTRAAGPVADELRGEGFRVEVLGRGGARALARALRAMPRPFVVHSHGACASAGRLAARLARAAGVVHHLHGTDKLSLKRRLLERALPADAYLACSQAVREDFERQTGAEGVEVLPNPVDLARFRFDADARRRCRAELGLAEDAPMLLTVGRLTPGKGQRVLLDALPLVAAARPGALAVFVGDGPSRALLSSPAARLIGARADVRPFLSACDVYVQPSVDREGLGLAALEALACERPVVASSLEGLREAVGDAGVLVPPSRPETLAAAVLELLGDPARRAALGRRGRQRVEDRFSEAVVAPRLLAVYRRRLIGAAR